MANYINLSRRFNVRVVVYLSCLITINEETGNNCTLAFKCTTLENANQQQCAFLATIATVGGREKVGQLRLRGRDKCSLVDNNVNLFNECTPI